MAVRRHPTVRRRGQLASCGYGLGICDVPRLVHRTGRHCNSFSHRRPSKNRANLAKVRALWLLCIGLVLL